MTQKKRLFIKTYGCQMNVYDSRRMADLMAPHGYSLAEEPAGADLVVLNTCHIREKAAEKVYSELGRLRILKEERGGEMLIAVAGCVAQAEGEEIMRRQPAVDFVFGPQTYHRLPELVAQAGQGRCAADTDFPEESKFDHLPKTVSVDGPTAFLTVQEGCDKFCTFCVVPYTRGAEFSRPITDVVSEAERLVDGGARELTLLGQNVNAYHGVGPDGREWGLGALLKRLAKIEGLERLRYTTSHPRDMDEELIEAHGSLPELMPYLHLPVQSGSDRILDAMNRGHTAEHYLRVVERIRAARPDIALTSDFIVGFPGESDADFEATLDLVREVGFVQAFSFRYSPRPGTPAAAAGKQVADAVKADRLSALQDLLEEHGRAFQASCAGREMPVLFDKVGRHPGQISGRSPYLQPVHLEGSNALIGQIRPVRIVAAHLNSLTGELIEATAGTAA